MSTDEFMKHQYLTLRAEISESKSRIFWLVIIGVALVLVSGYLAAEHPSAFANAAIPFLLLGLMMSFIAEDNNISRAGRYIREHVEPHIKDLTCWEHWLERHPEFREVDHSFVIGFSMLFFCFFAISTSLTLVYLDRQMYSMLKVGSAGVAYLLAALCVLVVFVRHLRAGNPKQNPSTEQSPSSEDYAG
ncbi:MFS transporter [Bythopirellula polymerisocia]|uniref:Transmembrane protein n=1 Tax=Bythopirellula polymerisocia TaxID=2528003 RepID=A0A5C6D0A5_9BACT|nr:MFS transporter [Bythopirellula polymerisocia]TWU30138.1 hypothetical protein Pla144_09240 [Bythopirellula polymerisocia]